MELLDKLVCVRLVDEIKDRKLKALRYSKEEDSLERFRLRYGIHSSPETRFTVHFSLNYPYTTYKNPSGNVHNWKKMKYGVLIPLESLIKSKQTPVNVHPADTFFLYEVKLTKDTRVVEQPSIERINKELERMGFPFIEGDIRGWRQYGRKERDEILELASELNVTSEYHQKTIFGRYEEFMKGIMNWRGCFGWDLTEPGDIDLGREAVRSYFLLKYILPRFPERMKRLARREMKKMRANLNIDAFVIHDS